MTRYDWMKKNEEVLNSICQNSIQVKHVKFLPMMEEYMQMMEQRLKKTYIIAHLSEKFGISECYVKKMVRCMSAIVN